MSTLIRDLRIVADDYPRVADDAELPAGPALLGWERWLAAKDALAARRHELGVLLPNTLDVAGAWADLDGLALIALNFPGFADGRAYSQARLLKRLGFAGELRAVGAAVVRDQLLGLHRCGFTSFELRADQDAARALSALNEFTLAYQPAADQQNPVFARRRHAA